MCVCARARTRINVHRLNFTNMYIYNGVIYLSKYISYHLSQKLKFLEIDEFNNFTIILLFLLTCVSRLPFNKWSSTHENSNFLTWR